MKSKEIKEHLDGVFKKIVGSFGQSTQADIVYENCYFAGGCVASLCLDARPNDYDIFFSSKKHLDRFTSLSEVLRPVRRSSLAITFKFDFITCPVQFVVRTSGDPEEVTSMFDFRHCASYYCPQYNYLEHDHHLVRSKKLEYQEGCQYPAGALKRMIKFLGRGYTISGQELGKLAKAITKISSKEVDKQLYDAGSGEPSNYETVVTPVVIPRTGSTVNYPNLSELFSDLERQSLISGVRRLQRT